MREAGNREQGIGNSDRQVKARFWLGLFILFALAVWMASCGERPAYAQAPAPGVYYAPDTNLEPLDVVAIRSTPATGRIDLAAYALTDRAIVQALAERAAAGVYIRIYRDHGEVASECRGNPDCDAAAWFGLLSTKNVEIRVKRSTVLMHLKAYGISSATGPILAREGSANFSPAGETRQDNSATFTTDPGSCGYLLATFDGMWNRPDNLTVAQAVASQPKWSAHGRKLSPIPSVLIVKSGTGYPTAGIVMVSGVSGGSGSEKWPESKNAQKRAQEPPDGILARVVPKNRVNGVDAGFKRRERPKK